MKVGAYRSRKGKVMKPKQERQIIRDMLSFFMAEGYRIRLHGEWKFVTAKTVDEAAAKLQGYDCGIVDLFKGKWLKRELIGSFNVVTARRTHVYFKRSMFTGWTNYELHNLAAKHNYNEVFGFNLK